MSLWSDFPFRWPLTSEALHSLASHRGECVCHFGSVIWALLDVLFPFIQLGNMPWSSGQSFPQPPWDFLKKKKVEQVTVLLSGNEWDCKAERCLSVCASLTPGSRTSSRSSVTLSSCSWRCFCDSRSELVRYFRNVWLRGGEISKSCFCHPWLCLPGSQIPAAFIASLIRNNLEAAWHAARSDRLWKQGWLLLLSTMVYAWSD